MCMYPNVTQYTRFPNRYLQGSGNQRDGSASESNAGVTSHPGETSSASRRGLAGRCSSRGTRAGSSSTRSSSSFGSSSLISARGVFRVGCGRRRSGSRTSGNSHSQHGNIGFGEGSCLGSREVGSSAARHLSASGSGSTTEGANNALVATHRIRACSKFPILLGAVSYKSSAGSLMLYRIVVGPAVMYSPGPMPQSELSVPAGQLMLYVVVPALYMEWVG